MQTPSQSFIEAVTNAVWGYISAILLQLIVLPLYGIDLNLRQNLELGLFFTVLAIVNNFLIRRLFNKRVVKNKT